MATPEDSPPPALTQDEQDALLCALVLMPDTYSRNRFFRLYQRAEVKKLRRRAVRLRSLVRDLADGDAQELSQSETREKDGRSTFEFALPKMNAKRKALLDALEASLVRCAVARARSESCDPADLSKVEGCLARLQAFEAQK